MSDYLVVYERAEDGGWGAYLPDLPGVVAAGDTRDEVERLIRDAAALYLDESDGSTALPAPEATAGTISV
jgi:predicted RNase H-like HicB family nuclease